MGRAATGTRAAMTNLEPEGQIRENGQQLLADAGFPDEASSLDQEMVGVASESVIAHLEEEGDLLPRAIEQGLIAA